MRVFLTGGSGFIGTHLSRALREDGHELRNLDRVAPADPDDRTGWVPGDLLDAEKLMSSLCEFAPDWVVHLAARTDCDEGTSVEAGYRVNTQGTKNLLDGVRTCGRVQRLVVTSSQFVCGPGRIPEHAEDYFPATVYGRSKVETERLTRQAELSCEWTIVRPTNIWGPLHPRYPREFWRTLQRGWYLHPDIATPTRCYGYVKNVVWQMLQILEAPGDAVHGQTFYLGDRPIDTIEWIERFHRALTGREAMRVVPYWVLRILARGGDLISLVTGKPFYLTSSRLRNMTSNYLTPIEATFQAFGEPPYSLEAGIRETVEWLRTMSPA